MTKETVVLKTGAVKVSSYSYKVRKVLWGILANKGFDGGQIERVRGKINSELYEIFRVLNIPKDDVVYIELPLKIEGQEIIPEWDELVIRHYKLVNEYTAEELDKIIKGGDGSGKE